MADTTIPKLISAMQLPAFYPGKVADVQMIETHISWVFLTGEWAYKIKKPIANSFLDYRTLEQRRRYCELELRLNQRWAPGIYDGVLPIFENGHEISWGPGGQVVEYAVRMRQFPQSALMLNMLSRHELSVQHVESLGEELARIHKQAPQMSAEGVWGTPEKIAADARDNFFDLAEHLPERLQGNLKPLTAWTNRAIENLNPVFVQRRQLGMIRECHGDLHLGNLIWLDERAQLFDGIEFNDDFRWIDVFSDLGFVLMDLEEHGRWDLANRMLNRYLEWTGDFSGVHLLRFYKLYRAMVRAKISVLSALQHRLDEAEDEDCAFARGEAYLRYGQRVIGPTSPELFVTFGLSGSGKSFGTMPLLDLPNVIRIRSDAERKRRVGMNLFAKSEARDLDRLYNEETTHCVYAHCLELAKSILLAGNHALVDATFLKRWQRHLFRQLADDLGIRLTIIPFHADERVLRARIMQRQAGGCDPSDATETVLEEQLRTMEPLASDELALCCQVEEVQRELSKSLFQPMPCAHEPMR